MPELPEVEALRLSLIPVIVGSTIQMVKVQNHKIVSGSGTVRKADPNKKHEFETRLIGKKIISLERRAKNIIINLYDDSLILVHLKMTGQLCFVGDGKNVTGGHPIQDSQQNLPHKHTYITFEMDNGNLYYNDVRQFGYVLYYPSRLEFEKINHFEDIGLEPFDPKFTVEYFAKKLKGKHSPIKTVLLNQSIVVGCGNIYCDESCFAAGILPTRKCSSLKKSEIEKLHFEIQRILKLAIESGGSSIANYLLADGSRGNYADYHLVYGKKGKPCSICGNILESVKLAGRTTVYCTVCQK